MKTFTTLFFILVIISVTTHAQKKDASFYSANTNKGFIENKGQIVDQNHLPNPAVKYLLCSPGLNVQLRDNGFSYDTYTTTYIAHATDPANNILLEEDLVTYNYHRIDISFPSCNPSAIIEATEASADYMNYYTVGTPQEGVTNVHHYKKVTYKNLYPKIDLEFNAYSNTDRPVEYNFIVHPGGDVNIIKIKYAGAQSTQLRDGKINLQLQTGSLIETMPLAYQTTESKTVNVFYKQTGNNEYGIVCDNFNANETLTIDPYPVLVWGTYYGGGANDDANDISYHNNHIYITGHSQSASGIATTGPTIFQSVKGGGMDAFLAEFDVSGVLIWATYFGGANFDDGHGVACYNDFIYVSGRTTSSELATSNAYQESNNNPTYLFNSFLVQFTNLGSRVWCTYFGWNGNCVANMVTCDNFGNVYMSGYTESSDTIASGTTGQNTLGGGSDAFLAKFNSLGQKQWGMYYGGSGDENAGGVFFDPAGFIYLSGYTTTASSASDSIIATATAWQSNYGGSRDGFLVKFNLAGQRIWGTYYGGSSEELVLNVTGNLLGEIFIVGRTESTNAISSNGSSLVGDRDAFVASFDPNGQRISGWYFGGTSYESAEDIRCNANGDVYITGNSSSTSLIATPLAQQVVNGGQKDAFLAKFTPGGTQIWGTYYGGNGSYDDGHGITLDNAGFIYICGGTQSNTNIATLNAHDPTYNGNSDYDAFIAKFNELSSPLPINQLNFTVKATKDNFVQLQWTTASELNNDYFTVEHSSDALHFTEVTKIKGAGNSNSTHNYSALDKNPKSGINYYRLKQTDFNGAFTYSATVAVMILNSENAVMLFPNPSPTGAFQFALPQEIKGNVTISVYNSQGEITIKEEISVNNNSTLNSINLEKFPSGLYCIIIEIEGNQFVTRAIKH